MLLEEEEEDEEEEEEEERLECLRTTAFVGFFFEFVLVDVCPLVDVLIWAIEC